MKNFYTIPDMTHSELVIALENFKYDTKVKCRIPTLMPLLPDNTIVEDNIRLSGNNVLNKNTGILGVGRSITCNYVKLYIPSSLSNGAEEGKKGEKFIAVFLGGDINKCTIIGRYEG